MNIDNLKKYDANERHKITQALIAWMKSQEIEPVVAAFVMARLAGLTIGLEACCRKHAKEGVDIMVRVMRRAAVEASDDSKE